MKKLFAILLCAILVVPLLASCASTLDPTTLTIGVDNTYPPMEYTDTKTNTNIGFDIDMAKEIGKRLDLKVKFIPTAWSGIFAALNARKFDCIISSVSMTTVRIKAFTFTKPYIANSQMIVVRPNDNSITKPTDLKGKRVGCQISTTSNLSADTLQSQGIKFSKLNTYDSILEPFQDMKSGRLDAIIVDEVVGQYYIGLDKANFKAASLKLTNEPIGVCFKEGNTSLRDKVQTAIDAMVKDGTMKQISIKWFGSDLTSNIDTKLKELQ